MSVMRISRRRLLGYLAGIPGIGAFFAGSKGLAQERSALAVTAARDVIRELGVRPFINAAGTYTAMSGSLMLPQVVDAMRAASTKFVMLDELHSKVGIRIAELAQCEAAMVTAGCASALSIATAACVAGSDANRIRQIPDTTGMKNEVIVQKTHRVGYDHAIRNAGVKLIEVETAAEMQQAINERTAMMFFLNYSNGRGQVHYEEFVEIARRNKVPTLIDAAADLPPVENLWRFTKMGFDLAAFSGGKGLRGPQSSGLLVGRKDLIAAGRLHASPNGDTLCRSNKVNKEEMVGLLVAIELFLARDHAATWSEWESRCRTIADAMRKLTDVKSEIFVPEIANAVPHLRVSWDATARKVSVRDAIQKLKAGEPSIEVSPDSRNDLVIGVWMLDPGQDALVAKRLAEVLG